jgi:hypothetical protein
MSYLLLIERELVKNREHKQKKAKKETTLRQDGQVLINKKLHSPDS